MFGGNKRLDIHLSFPTNRIILRWKMDFRQSFKVEVEKKCKNYPENWGSIEISVCGNHENEFNIVFINI